MSSQTQEERPSVSARILVVDDNDDSAECISIVFEFSGHQTRTAHSGEQALEIARQFLPDLVLLDIGLPGMNGYDVARSLRADPQLAKATLIALTGFGRAEDKQKALEAGFDFHVTKPVEVAVLRELLPSLFVT